MTVATLTPALLKNAPTIPLGKRSVRICDDRVRGFHAYIYQNGTVTFGFRYFDFRHRERTLSLGRLGDVTVAQARKRAEELRAQVSLGGDPAGERDHKRAVPTVANFITERFLPHVEETLRGANNFSAYCRRITQHLGRRALDEISVTDVAAFRTSLRAEGLSHATVNRHLAALRRAFNLALKWGLLAGPNPAAAPGMLPEKGRDHYLSSADIQTFFRTLDRETDQNAASALALLALTGARSGEILNAHWAHIDIARGLLIVPRNKAGRVHHIPLSPAAVRVLEAHRQRNNGSPFVFPGKNPAKPLSTLRGAWSRVKKAAGLDGNLHIHDLRHTFASALVNHGVPLHEVGVILGHSQLSTTRRYAHHDPSRLIATASIAAQAWNLPLHDEPAIKDITP